MDNIGDWLYIVFIAIAAISGFFGSGKKKRQQQQQQQQKRHIPDIPTHPSEDDYWNLPPVPQQQEVPCMVVKSVKKKKQPAKAPNYPPPFLNEESEIERAIHKQNNSMGLLLEEEQENTPLISTGDFQNGEALRKAVIYSEILNRKY